jgi:uncharacterized repeat protein (TIGR01451 family)
VCKYKFKSSITRLSAAVCFSALMWLGMSAHAQEVPPGCNACGTTVQIARNPAIVPSGNIVTYTIRVGNDTAGSCDIQNATVLFYCPGVNGQPDLANPIVLTNGLNMAAGTPPFVLAVTNCTVITSPGVTIAQARVEVTGGPGSCRLSAIDQAAGSATATVGVRHPCVSVTKECVNLCTPIGQPIQFRGVVRNCGDEPIAFNLSDSPPATITPSSGTIPVGGSVNYTGSYAPSGNPCGPFTDTVTVTATGTESGGTAVGNPGSASATCHVVTAPSISLTKDCRAVNPCLPNDPRSVLPGGQYTETFIVQNTGNVALNNVTIQDSIAGTLTCAATLAPGAKCTNVITLTAPLNNCLPITDRAIATAQNACPPDATCPFPPTVSSAEATCTMNICCKCELTISKEVACYLGNNNCGTFGKTATGVRDGSCPAFCYRFTIANPSTTIPLVLTSVIDATVGGASVDLTSQFNAGGPIAPGGSRTISVPARTHCANATNIVTAICTSPDGTTTTVRDTNRVIVLNINLDCVDLLLHSSLDTDGISLGEINTDGSIDPADNNHVELPPNTQNAPITLTLTLRNTGTATITVDQLLNVPAGLYDCATGLPVDPASFVPFDLAAGASRTIVLGCVDVSCPGASFSISAHGVASDQGGTLCVFNAQGQRVEDTSDACPASVDCAVEAACRVTGGGVLLPGTVDNSCIPVTTTIFPSADATHRAVRKITHGGQLGAPFAHMDCGAILGNKCIRGQWSHTRHYEGQGNPRDVIDMTFHSTTPKGIYDSLFCACLGCCDDGAFIPPSSGGKFKKFEICNPDDHKICGPQPRPAPANAIIWSGVGKMTPESDNGANGRNAEWVIFRIYIEDRSEPGGNKPGGAVEPADIYCFQAWKTGIKVSKRPDYNTVWADFRRALGEANCAFVASLEGSNPAVPIGTLPSPTVNGMTADIQDCGPMSTGNHQIHPVTGADAKCVDAPYQP